MSKKLIFLGSFVACLALVLFLANPVQAAGVTISGTAVAPDGSALNANMEGINVNLNPQGPGSGYYTPFIQGGVFSIANVVAGQYQVMINYGGGHDYTAAKPFIITVGSSNIDLGTIKMTTPSITGTLYAPDGVTPIPNAGVNIRTKDYTFNLGSGTDGSGNFKFGGLDSNTYIINARPPDGSSYAESADTEINYTGTVITGLSLKLTNPCIIGTVVQPDGSALSEQNAGINIDFYNQDRSIQKNTNTNKDSGGLFKFGSAPAGTYTLEVRTQNSAFTNAVPKTVTITSCAAANNVGNILLTSAQIQGVTYRPDGTTPLANAWVQIHTDDWSIQQGANTNENGQYSLGGVSAGTYKVRVNKPWNVTDVVEPDEKSVTITTGGSVQTVNFTFLSATKFLTGKVTKSDGTAVSGANVNANKEGAQGGSGTQTAADGSYSLSLSPGTWNINVNPNNCPGCPPADWYYSGQSQRVTFNNDTSIETKTLNITVNSASSTVTGKVLKADGSPVTNANVDVRTQDGSGNNNQVAPDGRFTVKVSAGTYFVRVWSQDNTLSFPEKSITIADNQVLDVGTITAKVKAARITVKTQTENGTAVPNVRLNAWFEGGSGNGNTTTDSSGIGVIAVTAGCWGVGIDQGGDPTAQKSRYVQKSNAEQIRVCLDTETSTASYADNPKLIMTLVYADATITGYTVDASGNVINGFCSYAFARPNATTNIFGQAMEYGSPVNCNNGQFTIYVPSSVASTFTLGVHTSPNSQYSSMGDQNVAVFADTTSTKNIVLKANDAVIKGQLQDQNGKPLTGCVSAADQKGSGNWFGDVHAEKTGQWFNSQINSDCTYRMSLLSGDGYRLGYNIQRGSGFIQRQPDPDPVTIAAGETTVNFTAYKADAAITGTVKDPDGNGVAVWLNAGNWPEIQTEGKEPSKEDRQKELHAEAQVNPDGSFSMPVLSGHLYGLNVGIPPGNPFLPPDFVEVNMKTSTSATVNLVLKKALGAMSGKVTIGSGAGVPVNIGYCWGWNEKGGNTGGPVQWGGSYSMNYAAGTWHFGCDSFDGSKFYRSAEVTVTITTQTSISQNFNLSESAFIVPPTVSESFDAGEQHVITLQNGTTINIPAGTLGDSGSTVTVTCAPTVNLIRDRNTQPFGTGYDISAVDSDNNAITSFNNNVTIVFKYTDDQLKQLGLDEDGLLGKYQDDTANSYKDPEGGCTINKIAKEITCATNHFTKFAIVSGQGAYGAGRGTANIMATPLSKGGPQIIVTNGNGKVLANFFAYDSKLRIGIEALTADVNGDGTEEIIVVPGPGAGPQVKVFNQAGKLLSSFFAFSTKSRTGIYLAAADVNDDGTAEIIVVPRAGDAPLVKVMNMQGKTLKQFYAYAKTMMNGIKLQTGDVDGDGTAEIIVYPRASTAPQIAAYEYDGKLVSRFYAYDSKIRGGYNLAVGDVNNDGNDEFIVAPRAGLSPQVAVFDKSGKQLSRFYAYASTFSGGVNVSVGDINGDGSLEIVVSPESKAGPQIRIFTYKGSVLKQFWAYDSRLRGNFTSFVADVNGDGNAEIITAPGEGMGPQVSVFNSSGKALSRFFTHNKGFRGGLNIFPAYE